MKNIAVFASGSGTNFEAIAQACADGRLDARVALMVCDKPGAPVIARAERFGIESFVFSPKEWPSKAAFESEIVRLLRERNVELVCLAGYMRIVGEVLLEAYRDRILNIHPSLLPAFKGAHAVEQAVAYGVKVYGITVHWVNADLDGGRIIAQKAFEYDGSDPEEVHRIGQKIEHQIYIDTIERVL
ncbi:MAG: phosphoribosylglycinamide formyltransferase [Bacteroidales bacterium]|nr:phosphoribosylglycinamide formyltransferase [Bacteroidales bacterium]